MNRSKFGLYIKESRIKKNYTQQELANLLFVDVTTVSKWERGVSYPDITLVPDICRVLEISEHELIESCQDLEYRQMKSDAKKYNNMKKTTFWLLNISYAIAIFTCFVVNIAVSHTLSWFFIVLASIVCSYCFCPTVTWMNNKYKKTLFIASTFISMFLLFLTCSIYTNNYWFMIATLGVLLAYFVIFYPILFKEQKKYLNKDKYNKFSKWFLLSYVLGMYVITNLLLISIYVYSSFRLDIGILITGGVFIIPIVLGILNLFDIAKSLNKPILISLVVFCLLLLVLGISRSIYLKNTETIETYSIDDVYNDIKIDGETFDVNVYLANDGKSKVVYSTSKKVTVETKLIDGVLIVSQKDDRKFYDRMFNFSQFKVDLYLANDLINALDIECSTGDIEIDNGFDFTSVNINNSTGDIEFKSNVKNDLKISNSTGDIEIENSNIANNVTLETRTGDVEITNVKCNRLNIDSDTGDTELNNVLVAEDFTMNGSTGDLEFDNFDAKNIYITLSTGDVEGTILSSKIFNVKSETGKVRVPETYEGGICKIKVSTGDIIINYK